MRTGALPGATSRRPNQRDSLRAVFAAVVVIVLVGIMALQAQGEAQSEPAVGSFSEERSQIVMLGTGSPLHESKRSGPSVAIIVAGTPYLVDFGPGVVQQASAAWERGVNALRPSLLSIAFATHLHSDHTTGLADLALAPWVLGRPTPLALYGPPGIEAMAEHITRAYAQDVEIRVGPLEFLSRANSEITAHDVAPGVVFENQHVRVEAFPVDHGSWKHAYGYRFDTADRSIVVSGDTRASESLVAKAKGCDVLIHEAYLESTSLLLPKSTQDYHSKYHTSGVELGKLAAQVQPGLLVVYHTLLFAGTEEQLIDEIRRNFKGRVVIASDLDRF